jgi:hypothetical protein
MLSHANVTRVICEATSMPKATIIADANTPEREIVDDWLNRWRASLPFVSRNEGCGCCVDIYRVIAPNEALDELPIAVLGATEWSGLGDSREYRRGQT